MQLYFIRHAQSTNNELYARTGSGKGRSADPELTEIGQQQTALLAHHLAQPSDPTLTLWENRQNQYGFCFTHLYTSLMMRAIETALPIAGACGLPLVAWPIIHERGGLYLHNPQTGEPEGLAGHGRSHLAQRFPRLILPPSLTDGGWWQRPRETLAEAQQRAAQALAELLARHGDSDDQIAIVSHGGFYQVWMQALYQLPFDADETEEQERHHFDLNNTGISRFYFKGSRVLQLYGNRMAHLPPELIT